ncbi:MAG: hypothetical protein K1060chlam5_00603 [Candidatus Anoxychlamydiales bacterium]|nr:hypothetical protein [Candidatus Anoxychlamydiales bacterium]
MENFRITIASLPDRENLVAEISYKNNQFAEISQETGELKIQFYKHPQKDYWEFSMDDILQIIEKAKKQLIQVG